MGKTSWKKPPLKLNSETRNKIESNLHTKKRPEIKKNILVGVPKSWSIGRVLRSFNSSIAETLGLNLSGKDLKIFCTKVACSIFSRRTFITFMVSSTHKKYLLTVSFSFIFNCSNLGLYVCNLASFTFSFPS